MWKQKIGISLGNKYEVPTTEIIRMLARIGFEAISPEWDAEANLAEIVETAKACDLEVQSLHAPFKKAADLWSEDRGLVACAQEELRCVLDDCACYQIPIMVAHVWKGFDYSEKPTRQGLQNFELIVGYAEKCGVKIAFENTEGEEFLYALMKHFEGNDTVGFCWDSGHEMCYNHSKDLLAKYGERLLVTHLNDNLGISRFDGKTYWTDDLHLLPYDGVADWDYNIERLKQARKLDILNFELNIKSKPERHDNDVYGDMSLERYFTEAYKRACKIAYRYAE